MSKSSWRVGGETAQRVITTADEAWCGNGSWTTADLGDFVQGMLEATLHHLEQLKPEMIQKCGEGGIRCPEHDHEHGDAAIVDLFTNHIDD